MLSVIAALRRPSYWNTTIVLPADVGGDIDDDFLAANGADLGDTVKITVASGSHPTTNVNASAAYGEIVVEIENGATFEGQGGIGDDVNNAQAGSPALYVTRAQCYVWVKTGGGSYGGGGAGGSNAYVAEIPAPWGAATYSANVTYWATSINAACYWSNSHIGYNRNSSMNNVERSGNYEYTGAGWVSGAAPGQVRIKRRYWPNNTPAVPARTGGNGRGYNQQITDVDTSGGDWGQDGEDGAVGAGGAGGHSIFASVPYQLLNEGTLLGPFTAPDSEYVPIP